MGKGAKEAADSSSKKIEMTAPPGKAPLKVFPGRGPSKQVFNILSTP
jgi:hypothetical protein